MNSRPPLTVVCFAVKQEAAPFRARVTTSRDIQILLTGMGPDNARSAFAQLLARARPARVITSGFAGALNPALTAETIVFGEDTPPDLAAKLRAMGAQPGRFHCATTVATTVREKEALRQATGADAVEMESGVIREACRLQGIPCATVRVILDTAQQNLPLDFNRLLNEHLQLDPVKLSAALAAAPGKIPALLRLRRQAQAAAKTLAQALVALLEPPSGLA
jgi:uridine phosphorylase